LTICLIIILVLSIMGGFSVKKEISIVIVRLEKCDRLFPTFATCSESRFKRLDHWNKSFVGKQAFLICLVECPIPRLTVQVKTEI